MTALFLLVQLFHPVCLGLAWIFRIEFHIHSEAFYLVLTAAFSFLLWKKGQNSVSIWNTLLFPITVLACAAEILMMRSFLAVPSAVVRCGCAYAMLSPMPERWYKYAAKVICVLLTILFVALCGFDLTFGSIGKTTVVQELPSPDGAYTAHLIDDDQGALGGDTLVKVTQPDIVPLGFAAFRPRTRTLYHGAWGEFKTATLSWQDETTLLINEIPFYID